MSELLAQLKAHIKAQNAKTRAWVNVDPANRWAGMVVEDLDHWARYDIYTVDQYEHYMAAVALSDAYKEVHGFRPRHLNTSEMTIGEINAYMDRLAITMEANAAWEAEIDAAEKEQAEFDARMPADPEPLPYEEFTYLEGVL